MDTKKWMEAFSEIDDAYLKEAMSAAKKKKKRRLTNRVMQCAAVAACVLILAAAMAGGVIRPLNGGSGSQGQQMSEGALKDTDIKETDISFERGEGGQGEGGQGEDGSGEGGRGGSIEGGSGQEGSAAVGQHTEADEMEPDSSAGAEQEAQLIFEEDDEGMTEADLALPDGYFFYEMTEEDIAGIWGQETLYWEGMDVMKSYDLSGSITYDGTGTIWIAAIYGYEKGAHPELETALFTIELSPDRLPPQCTVYVGPENRTCQVWGTDVRATYRNNGDRIWYTVEFLGGHENTEEQVGVHVECRSEKDQKEELESLLNCLVSQSLRPDGCLQLSQLKTDEVPEWRSERLDESQVMDETEFLAWFPDELPGEFGFDKAFRELGQDRNYLTIEYRTKIANGQAAGSDYIDWTIHMTKNSQNSESETAYRFENLTLGLLESLADESREAGQKRPYLNLRIRYQEDVFVNVSGYLTAEELWMMLPQTASELTFLSALPEVRFQTDNSLFEDINGFTVPNEWSTRELTEEEIASIWGQKELCWEGWKPAEEYVLTGTASYDKTGAVCLTEINGYDDNAAENKQCFTIYVADGQVFGESRFAEAGNGLDSVWGTEVASTRGTSSWAKEDRTWALAEYQTMFVRDGEEPVGIYTIAWSKEDSAHEMEAILTRMISQSLRPDGVLQLSQLIGDPGEQSGMEPATVPGGQLEPTSASDQWTAPTVSSAALQSMGAEVPQQKITDFAIRLLQTSLSTDETGENENILLSPLSVLEALAMTANGAGGQTLEQMEFMFGLDVEQLNEYLLTYRTNLEHTESASLNLANGIWMRDEPDFVVQAQFQDDMAYWYDAELRTAPFDDSTVQEINEWVRLKTKNRIPSLLDEIRDEAKLFLINAVAFDGTWEVVYEEHQIQDGIFTSADGEEQKTEMMHSTEMAYLEDPGIASGFIKYYEGRNYAFAALLPEEGIRVEEYAELLSGERLQTILSNRLDVMTEVTMPKFTSEYQTKMKEILQDMGMIHAFDPETADFTGIATRNGESLYINEIIHKTYLGVNEKGTEAGAVTAVIMEGAGLLPEEVREISLDRPFLYMIIDCEQQIPVFLGVVQSVK
ncbi:MAG: serpin family protein [Lachnospiraceae bacterium]|nr:serpin family protein [Lachnospiraceae bacterium]